MIIQFVRFVDAVDFHHRRGSYELTLFIKLALVRTFNTALLIFMVFSHQDLLGVEFQDKIQQILLFDAFITPWVNRKLDF